MKTLKEYQTKFGKLKGEQQYHLDKALALQAEIAKKPGNKKVVKNTVKKTVSKNKTTKKSK